MLGDRVGLGEADRLEVNNSPGQAAARDGDPPTDDRQFASGHIGLQNHGSSDVNDFRDIRVEELDGSQPDSGSGQIVIEEPGEHTVEFRSTDVAGNEEEVQAVTFTIGATAAGEPRLRVAGQPRRRAVGPRKQRTRFRFRATAVGDAPSGTVRLCARAPARRVAIRGRRCVTRQIPAGATRRRPVKLRIKPAARGKVTRIRLIARGPNVDRRRTVVRLRVRR